jgi:hypothetical protein
VARSRSRRPSARPPQSPGRSGDPSRRATGDTSGGARGTGGALPSGAPRSGAPRSAGRTRLERASAPALVALTRVPRWLVAVLMAVLLVAGLAVEGPVGAALLLVLAAFLGWLLAVSWPVLAGVSKVVRVLVVAAVVTVAVMQAGA